LKFIAIGKYQTRSRDEGGDLLKGIDIRRSLVATVVQIWRQSSAQFNWELEFQ
jgi:hypothetical protein